MAERVVLDRYATITVGIGELAELDEEGTALLLSNPALELRAKPGAPFTLTSKAQADALLAVFQVAGMMTDQHRAEHPMVRWDCEMCALRTAVKDVEEPVA